MIISKSLDPFVSHCVFLVIRTRCLVCPSQFDFKFTNFWLNKFFSDYFIQQSSYPFYFLMICYPEHTHLFHLSFILFLQDHNHSGNLAKSHQSLDIGHLNICSFENKMISKLIFISWEMGKNFLIRGHNESLIF